MFDDHLSLDAVVAFADGELSLVAFQRAAAHIEQCPACAAEVAEQTSARDCLRRSGAPQIPGALFDQLRSIPLGLAMAAPSTEPDDFGPGQHRGRTTRSRGFRMGAGFLLAGIAVSGLAAAGADRPVPQNPIARPGIAPAVMTVPVPLVARPVVRRVGG